MQPNPQTRKSPAATGLHVAQANHLERQSTAHLRQRPDVYVAELDTPVLSRIPALLRHHASFIDIILVMICAGQSISLAGRQSLQFTADRLRQIAGVIR